MKSGTILRTYNYIGNNETEKESIYINTKLEDKINEITSNAQLELDKLLKSSEDRFNDKVSNIESHIELLNNKFNDEVTKLKDLFNNEINKMKIEYEDIIKEQEETFSNYIGGLEEDVKEILMTLFKQFFFTEYQNTSNLESIIHECLSQLEDSKNIKILMHKNIFEKFKENHKDTVDMISKNNISFSFHNKENLILEFKTEYDCIEVDFNKQMEDLKETLLQS